MEPKTLLLAIAIAVASILVLTLLAFITPEVEEGMGYSFFLIS